MLFTLGFLLVFLELAAFVLKYRYRSLLKAALTARLCVGLAWVLGAGLAYLQWHTPYPLGDKTYLLGFPFPGIIYLFDGQSWVPNGGALTRYIMLFNVLVCLCLPQIFVAIGALTFAWSSEKHLPTASLE